MIYGYDQAVQLPVRDLYDSGMMQMAIGAAKDMYDRGEKRLDDIYAFQDFYSPIAKDVDYVYNNTIGKAKAKIDELYSKGIDPLRSAEGRAAIAQIKRGINYAEIAKRKENAENAKLYLKAKAELQSKGLWSPEMEAYALGGKTLENWDTETDGMWTRTSPIQYQTMDDIIEPIVSKLDPIFDAELTAAKNDGFDYSTVTEDRIRQTIDDNMVDLIGAGTAGGYYYNKAYELTGDKEKAKELLKDWYVDRAKDHVRSKREANPYKLDEVRTKNDNWLDAQKAARDSYYDLINAGADTNGDGKISADERKNYAELMQNSRKYSSGNNKDNYNIFREADAKDDTSLPTGYVLDNANANKINPVHGEITYRQDQKTKSWLYEIPANIINNSLYSHDSVYSPDDKLKRLANFRGGNLDPEDYKSGSYYFYPNGQLKAKYDKRTKRTRYFISGVLAHSSNSGDFFTDENGATRTYELEVTEQFGKYGKNQEK